MRTVERVLTGLLVVAVVAGAVAMALVLRAGQAPPPEAARAAAPDTSGYPGVPEGTFQPAPEVGQPSPYPEAGDFEPPIRPTIVPTDVPLPTPTPFWNWPTPVRAGGPTPTALPVPKLADGPQGTICTFAQLDAVRSVERLSIGPDADVLGASRLDTYIPSQYWDGPVPSGQAPVGYFPSPGGSYVAMVQNRFESDSIYVMDLLTGEAFLIETMFQYGDIRWVETFFGAWHPDERHIYLRDTEYGMVILVDLFGQEPRKYISEALARGGLAITSDGQQLAYATQSLGQSAYTLWLSRADGSDPKRILEDMGDISVVSWSPSGDRLLVLRGAQLWLVDRDGSNLRSLDVLHTGAWGLPMPQWSPDGTLIAYSEEVVALEKKDGELDPGMEFQYATTYLVNAQTGERRALVPEHSVGDLYPAWSPDGRYVAFLSDWSGATEVWVTRLDDSSILQLTESGQTHGAPIWVPAGKGE